MRLVIKSKILKKTLTFDDAGDSYIYVDLNGKEGTLGNQICKGGYLSGSCLKAKDDTDFVRVCKNWYRAYIKNNCDF